MHNIEQILKNSFAITAFVLSVMLLIEYVNVTTKGSFSEKLKGNKFKQILLATLFGVVPGCLGTYTIVSLYTHNLAGIGALVAVMIATFGDESFYLFSMAPQTGIILSVILIVIAIVFGFLTELLFGKKISHASVDTHLQIHSLEDENKPKLQFSTIVNQLKHITFHRALLIASLMMVIVFVIFNGTGHSHDFLGLEKSHGKALHETHDSSHFEFDWVALTFISVSLFSLFVVLTVSDHFLEDHLWKHILKKHFLKVFLWTIFALVAIKLLEHFVHINEFVTDNLPLIMLIALLVGLIPESGPHMMFVTMYIAGTIPLSILLANSIVQDGHGAIPLFAESKRSFFVVKFINFVVGALVGYVGLYLGY